MSNVGMHCCTMLFLKVFFPFFGYSLLITHCSFKGSLRVH